MCKTAQHKEERKFDNNPYKHVHKYVIKVKTEQVKEYRDSGQIPDFSGLHEVVVDCTVFLQEIWPSRTEFKQQYINWHQ